MNKKRACITIIISVYNGARYIRQCIESVLKQDYSNFELIIVNDGSKDNSGEIIEEYARKDTRIKVISQKNSGVSAARNAALDVAQGDYVCFLDQDDYIADDYISYFYKLILENNAEIALTPRVRRFREDKPPKSEDNLVDRIEIWSGKRTAIEMLYYNLIIAPWNKMISRELIEENNLRFDLRFFGGEGFLFSIECFQRAKIVAVGQKEIYYYRLDNVDSGMTKFSMAVIDSSIESQKVIRNNILEKTSDIMAACNYANWHTHCDCFNTFIGCCVEKEYKEKFLEIKKVCQHGGIYALKAPIPIKEKIKGVSYWISPIMAARLINRFRLRKFTKSK